MFRFVCSTFPLLYFGNTGVILYPYVYVFCEWAIVIMFFFQNAFLRSPTLARAQFCINQATHNTIAYAEHRIIYPSTSNNFFAMDLKSNKCDWDSNVIIRLLIASRVFLQNEKTLTVVPHASSVLLRTSDSRRFLIPQCWYYENLWSADPLLGRP